MAQHICRKQGKTTTRFLFIFFLWFAVQNASAQIGLTFPSSTVVPLRSNDKILALPLTGPVPKLPASNLLTKISERQFPATRGASMRESEIAAIFQGVAYGASTFSLSKPFSAVVPSTETTPTTSATTTTISTTNSLPDNARSILMGYQTEKDAKYIPASTTSTPDNDEVTSDSVLQGNDDLEDTSELHRTLNPYAVNRNVPNQSTIPTFQEDTIILSNNMIEGHNGMGLILPENGIKWSLGAAWWIHVYLSAGLFALVAAASLCCLIRLSPAARTFSHFQYIIILILIFLAAILRCLHLFHDPYGIKNKLPEFITALIEEISWPCLIGAMAVAALSLYQSSKCSRAFPKSSCLPNMIWLCTIVHLVISVTAHLMASLVGGYSFPLRITAQSVAVVWGSTVGFGSLWAVWKTEKPTCRFLNHLLSHFNRSATDDLVTSDQAHFSINRGAILISAAGGAQIMLATLHFYMMLVPVTPVKHIWVWWGRVSMARILEIIISVCILAEIYGFTSENESQIKHANPIFSVLTTCKTSKGGRSANVFPVQNEKGQFLGSFDIHATKNPLDNVDIIRFPTDWTYTTPRTKNTTTVNSVTTLLNRERTHSAATFRPSSMLVNDSGFVRFRTLTDPEQPMEEVLNKSLNFQNVSAPLPHNPSQHYSTQTLPNTHYYCKPTFARPSSPERTPLRNPIRSQTLHTQRSKLDYLQRHMRGRSMSQIRDKYTWTPVTSTNNYDVQTVDRYEGASYYNDSFASSGSNMYSTPHLISPSQNFSQTISSNTHLPEVNTEHHYFEENRHLKPVSSETVGGGMDPSICSPVSENHVDYLTDFSSSNDCVTQKSVPHRNCSKREQNLLTLPLSSTWYSNAHNFPRYSTPGKIAPVHLSDVIPESAVIFDYSTSAETEEEGEKDDIDKSLDLLRLRSNSINEMLKVQSRAGLLSKFVGSNVTSYGYFPLDVEDTSSPSQEDSSFSRIRKDTSSTDLNDTEELSRMPTTLSPIHTKNPNSVTSL